MSLPQIFQWVVSAHLDNFKNVELVLLKGHLLIEVAIDNAIHLLDEEKNQDYADLSFHKKLQTLNSLQEHCSSNLTKAIEHLQTLNRIRNRLAHEFMFTGGKEALGEWAEAVLVDFPGMKVQRHTFRTKLIQAFGSLASVIIDPRSNFSVESAGPNTAKKDATR